MAVDYSNQNFEHANYIKIHNNQVCDEHSRSNEEFGAWRYIYSNYIDNFSIVSEDDNWDLIADFEVSKSDELWLVYVVYSTGDSFGNSYGNVQYIGIFKSKEKAHDCARLVRENENQVTLEHISESGKVIPSYSSYYGYFEHIEDIVVKSITESDKEIYHF